MTVLNSNSSIPLFQALTLPMNFKNHFVTPPTHPHYTMTVNAYNKYADTLAIFFHQNADISQESAPRAYLFVQEQ